MDIVLIGSGVSATLLAQAIVRRGCFRTLRLIDDRKRLAARRFAYWSDGPTPFDDYVDASWPTLRVVDPHAGPIDLPLSRYAYQTFRPARWHAQAHEQLRETPGVEFVAARVDSVEVGEHEAVARAGGVRHRADWVFSSAPLWRTTPACWQRFEGWEIALPEGELDCAAATWMDFRTPASGDFRFIYALPLGPRRLFIEHVSHRPANHGDQIRSYLKDVLRLRGWERVDLERGATPLYAKAPDRRAGRVVRLGVAGGRAKTSTGYALMRMWREAEEMAEGLATKARPSVSAGAGPLYRVADSLFLELVQQRPDRLRGFLIELCRDAPSAALLSFLDDRASIGEQFEVARAAPGWLRWCLRGRLMPQRASRAEL